MAMTSRLVRLNVHQGEQAEQARHVLMASEMTSTAVLNRRLKSERRMFRGASH